MLKKLFTSGQNYSFPVQYSLKIETKKEKWITFCAQLKSTPQLDKKVSNLD